MKNKKVTALTDSASDTFGNAYRSAVSSGYSHQTARNFNHLKPEWLSENIGQVVSTIQPEELTHVLTNIVHSEVEPTIIKLKAMEMMMRYHGMLKPQAAPTTVTLSVDLTGAS